VTATTVRIPTSRLRPAVDAAIAEWALAFVRRVPADGARP
jgi:hypothetical protein